VPGILKETVTQGPVTVTLTASPDGVFLDRDILVTIRATSPANVDVTFPPISDRLLGFLDAGHFDREPARGQADVTRERVIRLTPLVADEYRIAPMAVTFVDTSEAPPKEGWLATPPVVFPVHAVTDRHVDNDIATRFEHRWIYPPLRSILGYVVILLALVAIGFLTWKLIRRAHRRIRLMRMSPRERALEELSELLARKLIEKALVKDFYIELTMVVRRYIERQHRVRAPEQTTEEFLTAVSDDPHFGADVVERLSRFLEAADLVKFAAYQPDRANVDDAVGTAKDYITTDADRAEALEGVATVTEHKEKLL
jgi:hypothetical protein